MLAGGSPYSASTPAQMMAAHVAQAPAPVELKRADCPPALAALVMRCLEKDPGNRWQSADEIVNQLRMLGDAARVRGASPRSGRRIAVVAALVLLAIVAALVIRRRAPRADAASASVIAYSLHRARWAAVQLSRRGHR